MDLKKQGIVEEFINQYFQKPIDIIFCLAIDKHVGLDRVLQILDNVKFKVLYWEGSSAEDENTPHVQNTNKELGKRFHTEMLGHTNDRSKRYIWKAVNKEFS